MLSLVLVLIHHDPRLSNCSFIHLVAILFTRTTPKSDWEVAISLYSVIAQAVSLKTAWKVDQHHHNTTLRSTFRDMVASKWIQVISRYL
jgi:hypothetical protein